MTGREAIERYLATHATFKNDQVATAYGLAHETISSAARRMVRAGSLVIDHLESNMVVYRRTTTAPKSYKNPVFDECRNSPNMQRLLFVYGRREGISL